MDAYNKNYYDLLSRAFLGDVTDKRLQGFLDDVVALKYNTLQFDGVKLGGMQLDFTYTQLRKELALNVMSTYYDIESPAKPKGTQGIEIDNGTIPRMKEVENFDERKYRNMLIDEQRFGATNDRVVNAAKRELFNTIDTLVGRHTNSLTYQRNQMISSGKLTLNSTNNPGGLPITLSAHIPSANKTILENAYRWWTDGSTRSSEGASADPIKDMKAMVRTAKNAGVTRVHFEIDEVYFQNYILGHSKVAQAIAISMFPAADSSSNVSSYVALLGDDVKRAALEKIVGAPIKLIDSIVAVESWSNGAMTHTQMRGFEQDVVVLVPDGNIAELLTVEPIAFQDPAATYGRFYDGRLLLTVTANASKKCQSFETEMTSLVVPYVPQYMWYLYPNNA